MLSQDQWSAIRGMSERGMGRKTIARALGLDVKTVRRYLRHGGREPYRRRCPARSALELEYGAYLRQRAPQVDWCAVVLWQEIRARGYAGTYELVKRWVRPLRETERRLEAATVRFETGPGRQSQVDWGSMRLVVGGEAVRVHLFLMTLGYSRRTFARAYPNEQLSALLDAHERAFAHFGGRTAEILYDNPRTIVVRRDVEGRHIEWNPSFRDFADYYGFTPRLCRPYRAQTKGKVESGVKYVKRNALLGRDFASWEGLNEWLLEWSVTIADLRIHGTTHERPVDRFEHEALIGVAQLAPYRIERHPTRSVANDCLVALDTNRYSVPWQLVGESLQVSVIEYEVRIHHRGRLVAQHPLASGRHQVVRDPDHFVGLFRREQNRESGALVPGTLWDVSLPEVEVRDLAVYESVAAGGAL